MERIAQLAEKIVCAVKADDLPAIRALAEEVKALRDPKERTHLLEHACRSKVLLMAASKNRVEMLQQLILLGAQDNPEDSALSLAARQSNMAAVGLLLGAGANPFAGSSPETTPLAEAVCKGSSEASRLFMERADFSGRLAVKVKRVGGLGSKYVERLIVAAPFAHASSPGTVQHQLWMFTTSSRAAQCESLPFTTYTIPLGIKQGPKGKKATLSLRGKPGNDVCYELFKRSVGELDYSYSNICVRARDKTPAAVEEFERLLALLSTRPLCCKPVAPTPAGTRAGPGPQCESVDPPAAAAPTQAVQEEVQCVGSGERSGSFSSSSECELPLDPVSPLHPVFSVSESSPPPPQPEAVQDGPDLRMAVVQGQLGATAAQRLTSSPACGAAGASGVSSPATDAASAAPGASKLPSNCAFASTASRPALRTPTTRRINFVP